MGGWCIGCGSHNVITLGDHVADVVWGKDTLHKCGLVCAERCVAPEAEHMHLVRGCQLCNCLANVAKPDNAQCLATQLLHVIRRPFPSSLGAQQTRPVHCKPLARHDGKLREAVAVHALRVGQHHVAVHKLREQQVLQTSGAAMHPLEVAEFGPDLLDVCLLASIRSNTAVEDHRYGRPLLLRQTCEISQALAHLEHLNAGRQLLQHL
mmetsp:Transcript_20230/g.60065  ORF Transcript_20230/g.60065 Transcript_20230/m.60065 type:complete len:208 (-) Transcript_20230:265-888(-)